MKKSALIIALILCASSASAQFKNEGLKVIGEAGLGVNWTTLSIQNKYMSDFGYINPGVDVSLGYMLTPYCFLGGGLGYNVGFPTDKASLQGFAQQGLTEHGLKLFGHARFYTKTTGNGWMFDVKVGYKRMLAKNGANLLDIFGGVGYMFGGRYAVTLGYANSLKGAAAMTLMEHGPAAKFSIEF